MRFVSNSNFFFRQYVTVGTVRELRSIYNFTREVLEKFQPIFNFFRVLFIQMCDAN